MSSSRVMTITSLPGRVLPLNQYLQKKRSVMVSEYASGVILDVGCGPAEIVRYLRNENQISYVGIDTNKEMIEKLKRKYPSLNFYLVDVDHDDLPSPVSNSKFDTILLIAVIEHLKCPERLLRKASELLNYNGKLIVTTATPNGEHVHNILAIFGITSREAVREHKSAARSAYSFQAMSDLILPFGFQVEAYRKFEFGLNQMVVFRKNSSV